MDWTDQCADNLSCLEKNWFHTKKKTYGYIERNEAKRQAFVEQLAAAFNLMLEKLQQSQTALKNLATLDELTGLYNRREFNLQLKNELERSRRYGHCFSLVILDIDYFKKLNDTCGHQAGGLALRSIAAFNKARAAMESFLAAHQMRSLRTSLSSRNCL